MEGLSRILAGIRCSRRWLCCSDRSGGFQYDLHGWAGAIQTVEPAQRLLDRLVPVRLRFEPEGVCVVEIDLELESAISASACLLFPYGWGTMANLRQCHPGARQPGVRTRRVNINYAF
jgi:hypothetical protein